MASSKHQRPSGILVPAPAGLIPDTRRFAAAELQQRQRSKRKAHRRPARLPITAPISPALTPAACDPDGVLDELGIISPHDFWRWYHIEDGPEDPHHWHMGQRWGEIWCEFLQSDPLVLAGALPIVLHKRAQMIGVSEDRRIQVAEFKALQRLRHRLEHLDETSIGGLVTAICGRVQVNIQCGEYELAAMHLQAMRRLVDMQPPDKTVWICAAWTDLRVVSSTSSPPALARYVPDAWHLSNPSSSPDQLQACQQSALSNLRALGHTGAQDFHRLYDILRHLHELEILTNTQSNSHNPPIEPLYHTIYSCCLLDAKQPTSLQLSLLAITLKLTAWDKASRYIPRGGEIERNMLRKAKALLTPTTTTDQIRIHTPGAANTNALTWILLTLASTAYMFQRADFPFWISHLRAVCSVKTASAFHRVLKGWPSAPWWFSLAVPQVCRALAPKKGSWEVWGEEAEPVPVFATGLRLKLLVISA